MGRCVMRDIIATRLPAVQPARIICLMGHSGEPMEGATPHSSEMEVEAETRYGVSAPRPKGAVAALSVPSDA